MIWRLCNDGREIYRGSYKGALAAAERLGVLYHLVTVEMGGKSERVMVPGRGFTEDGTEIAARLDRGWSIAPVAQLARRAAA
ncbi:MULTISPECIES: hypothetical protein [Methylorubrum]|uniref:hypothetical protein n=1 Tax=Methylorubrum TaxID=2282523 RepID=UPI00209E3C25|nr:MULTISPECIES: hypothetical protein [Methylorubrum]MCP1550680.1 hypothetical protein [Methylorubrum zatmanii]MCP1552707.1 hypothetical protein [Methylorubrum extorquens]MCP1580983.1 hypothetical protein [Methylorubrum extorquens]